MRKLFKVLGLVLLLFLSFVAGWAANEKLKEIETKDIPTSFVEKLRPLEKYSFENLISKSVSAGTIMLDRTLKDEEKYKSELFFLEFDPTLEQKQTKRVSGVINTPKADGKYPLVVMLRGYVDQTIYSSGVGTQKAGEFFVQNGFISIAPDFLGYAESDREADNIFESRFQTYTTALTLLQSLDQISNWDEQNIFIWGHSNGGQMALTILEITGQEIPTTLWAPVSKPFPYSILYYTDESEDRGKLIRRELAKFEEDYEVEKYSLTNYLDRIKAPLQIHQGTADDAVPKDWTDTLVKNLKKLEKDAAYFIYPGADHNLRPASPNRGEPSWDTVVARDLAFFKKHLR